MDGTISRKLFIFIVTNQYQLCKIFIPVDITFHINILISRKREAQNILFLNLGITTDLSRQDQEVSSNITRSRETFCGSYHETSSNSQKSSVESHSVSYRFSIYYGMKGNQQDCSFKRVKEYINNNPSTDYHV